MAKTLQLPDEFYETYKLLCTGRSVGEIRDSINHAQGFQTVNVRTLNNWKNKFLALVYDKSSFLSDEKEHIDMPWLWEKFESYSEYGISSHLMPLADVMNHRLVYSRMHGSNPSIREIKYIDLLGHISQGAWSEEDVVTLGRRFAMTEFAVACGELAASAIEAVRNEIDEAIKRGQDES